MSDHPFDKAVALSSTGAVRLARQGAEPLLATAWASNFRDGFFDQVAELWSCGGELLATSHQLVYFRE